VEAGEWKAMDVYIDNVSFTWKASEQMSSEVDTYQVSSLVSSTLSFKTKCEFQTDFETEIYGFNQTSFVFQNKLVQGESYAYSPGSVQNGCQKPLNLYFAIKVGLENVPEPNWGEYLTFNPQTGDFAFSG
jgi:hypothetical protein